MMKNLTIVLVSMGLIAGAYNLVTGMQDLSLFIKLFSYTLYNFLGLYWIRALIKEK